MGGSVNVQNSFVKKVWAAATGERPTLEGEKEWLIEAWHNNRLRYRKRLLVVPSSDGFAFPNPPSIKISGLVGGRDVITRAYDPEGDLAVEFRQSVPIASEGEEMTMILPQVLVDTKPTEKVYG